MRNAIYTFSPEKNQKLIVERNISFEEVIAAILQGCILDIIEHNNPKYRKQKIYVVELKGYVYLVPSIIDDQGNIFLKTVIPSRKAKKKYLKVGK